MNKGIQLPWGPLPDCCREDKQAPPVPEDTQNYVPPLQLQIGERIAFPQTFDWNYALLLCVVSAYLRRSTYGVAFELFSIPGLFDVIQIAEDQ